MALFIDGEFSSHSGGVLPFKIECDALTDDDLVTIAKQFARHTAYRGVRAVPRGGDRFAKALGLFLRAGPILVVDDVLTTGASITLARERLAEPSRAIGVVLFARGQCPDWVIPIFQMHRLLV